MEKEIIFTDAAYFNKDRIKYIVKNDFIPSNSNEMMALHGHFTNSTFLFNKSHILSFGGYNESLQVFEDYDLWLRIKDNSELRDKYNADLLNANDKNCLCEGLSASTLLVKGITDTKQSLAVAICPGPNLAYFSKVATLKEMVDHIYGRINLITHPDRPNMFLKELSLYIDYLHKKIDERVDYVTAQKEEFFNTFHSNLIDGINFYKKMIPEIAEETDKIREKIQRDLEALELKLMSYALAGA